MKSLPLLAVCSALAFAIAPGAAFAGQAEFHLDTSAPAPKRLEVDTWWLDVKLNPIAGDQVTIKADFTVETIGSDGKARDYVDRNQVYVETEGDRLVIRQGKRGEGKRFRLMGPVNSRGSMVIGVPAGIPLELDTASGDITLSGDFGAVPLKVETASGDLTLNGRVQSVEIDAASGTARLNVDQPLEQLRAGSASGDLELKGGAREVKASAASGNIRLEGLSGSADVGTASGDVSLFWTSWTPGSKIEVSASSGDATVELPAGVALQGGLSSSSGRIESDLLGKPGRGNDRFQLVGGDGTIRIDTASGDIRLGTR